VGTILETGYRRHSCVSGFGIRTVVTRSVLLGLSGQLYEGKIFGTRSVNETV
jgi:hypothetical protein